MIKDDIILTGKVRITVKNKEGNVIEDVTYKNLVVTTGKNHIADRMKNNSTAMSHMAVGTGTTSAAAGQTALVSESARVALTSSTVSTNTIEYVGTFPAGTGTALTEAAVLNASSSGTMLCRTVFTVINKGSADSLVITWTITVG
jgi:hypothetical protein